MDTFLILNYFLGLAIAAISLSMNTMMLASKSIFLTVIFVFSMITLLSVYGQEKQHQTV